MDFSVTADVLRSAHMSKKLDRNRQKEWGK